MNHSVFVVRRPRNAVRFPKIATVVCAPFRHGCFPCRQAEREASAISSYLMLCNQISEEAVRDVLSKVRSRVPTLPDLIAAVRSPLIPHISRWELWTLVGFVRHERRQKWVGYVVETKLKGSGHDLGAMGALAHPEGVEQSNKVPDTPGWRYFFHGRGCCLTHEDGTTIDVDFADDGSAEEIDPYFYTTFLSSAQKLEWTDAQLRYDSPFETAWHFDVERLGTMKYVRHNWRFRVTNAGRQLGWQLQRPGSACGNLWVSAAGGLCGRPGIV